MKAKIVVLLFWNTQDDSRRWRIKAWNQSLGKCTGLWGWWVCVRRRSSGRKGNKTATISAESWTETLTHLERRSDLLPSSNSLNLFFCSLLCVLQYWNTYFKAILKQSTGDLSKWSSWGRFELTTCPRLNLWDTISPNHHDPWPQCPVWECL